MMSKKECVNDFFNQENSKKKNLAQAEEIAQPVQQREMLFISVV